MPKEHWPTLCDVIEARLSGQLSLVQFSYNILQLAGQISSRLMHAEQKAGKLYPLDFGSIRHTDTRSVGGESVCLISAAVVAAGSLSEAMIETIDELKY